MDNLLLSSLSESDNALLAPLLKPIRLDQQKILFEMGSEVPRVYFPTSAIISLVVSLSTGESVEAAMVGRDGVVGASSALDGKIAMNRAIVQLAGDGMMCNSDDFKATVLKSPTLLSMIMRHEQTVYAQAQQSAACIAAHNVDSRLARWLLRSRDLAGSEVLPFTQEFLGEMLGVRRTSVSVVAHTLQQAGMIEYSRGKIKIRDVDALRQTACECYKTVRLQYSNLLGKKNPSVD
jgi:CRP-like cAMP-binding protein